ncbi:MAG: hypothetical protein ACREPI_02650 [Candidatus Dormibacterales bacterium]
MREGSASTGAGGAARRRRPWPHVLGALSVALAVVGALPLVGLVLGPVAFVVSGAALHRLPPGWARLPARTGRVLSVLVTVVWLVVVVVYATSAYQLARGG